MESSNLRIPKRVPLPRRIRRSQSDNGIENRSVEGTISLPLPSPKHPSSLEVLPTFEETPGDFSRRPVIRRRRKQSATEEEDPEGHHVSANKRTGRKVRLAEQRRHRVCYSLIQIDLSDNSLDTDCLSIQIPQEEFVNVLIANESEFAKELDVDLLLRVIGNIESECLDEIKTFTDQANKTSAVISKVILGKYSRRLMKTFVSFLASIHPSLFNIIKGRLPNINEALFTIGGFVEDKKLRIRKESKQIECSERKLLNLDSGYVQLFLVKSAEPIKDPTDEASSKLDEYKETVISTDHGEKINARDLLDKKFLQGRTLLLKGRSGIGKTTLLQWLCYEWTKYEQLQTFPIVFLLSLRVLLTLSYPVNLIHLLHAFCLYSTGTNFPEEILQKWLRNWSHSILIMLDGVDEIKDLRYKLKYTKPISDITEEALPGEILINLLRGNLLPECKLILASRPTLGHHAPMCDMTIEIMGLSKEGIQHYMDKNIPKEKVIPVEKLLAKNPILMSLCSVTYYCVVLCSLITQDETMVYEELSTYTRFTACMLIKMASRNENGEIGNADNGTSFKAYLPKLAKVAYWAVFCREPTDSCMTLFDIRDMAYAELTKADLEQAYSDGIVLCSDIINDRQCRTKKFLFQFSHLTLQELFASVYFLEGETGTKSEKKRMLEWVVKHGYFNMVVPFIFGLRFDNSCEYIHKLRMAVRHKPHIPSSIHRKFRSMFDSTLDTRLLDCLKALSESAGMSDEQDRKLQVAQLLYESNRPEVTEGLVDSNLLVNRDGDLHVKDVALTALDIMALVYVAKQARNLRRLHLVCVNISDASFQNIAILLGGRKSLQVLNISHNILSPNVCDTIETMLPLGRYLTTLQLDDVGFGDSGVLSVVNGLLVTSSLTCLSLNSNGITDDGVKYLAKDTVPHLTKLSLDDNSVTDVGVMNMCFSDMLKYLKVLYIGDNQISVTGADYLISNFFGDELSLRGNQIALNKMKPVARKSVHLIDLKDNEVGLKRVLCLVKQLRRGKPFPLIDLENMELNDYSFSILVRVLVGKTTLQRISLTNNKLTRKSEKAIKALVSTCPNLKTINVQGNGCLDVCDAFKEAALTKNFEYLDMSRLMNEEGALQLSSLIRENRSLGTLRLNHNKLKPTELCTLIKGLKYCSSLTSLSLVSCDLGQEHAECLTNIIRQCSSLLFLDISRNLIDSKTMAAVSDALRGNPKLEFLDLSHNNIGDNGTEELCDAIEINTHIQKIMVASNNITAKGLTTIASTLTKCHSLTELNLSHNGSDENSVQLLCAALGSSKFLRDIKLQDMSITSSGAEELAKSLTLNSSIKYLDLFQNEIKDAGAIALGNSLLKNDTLERLVVRANRIGPDGICGIAQALQSNKTLYHLDIGMNKIGVPGAREISNAISQNNTLRELDLYLCELDHGAICHLMTGLKVNTSLVSLGLGWNNIASRGVLYIANALVVNKHLKILDLSENNIGSGGALHLAAKIEANPSITHLNLEGNQLHAVGVDAIVKMVKQRQQPLHAGLQRNGVIVGNGEDILSQRRNFPQQYNCRSLAEENRITQAAYGFDTYYNHGCDSSDGQNSDKRLSYENVNAYLSNSLSTEHTYVNTPVYANEGPGTLRPSGSDSQSDVFIYYSSTDSSTSESLA